MILSPTDLGVDSALPEAGLVLVEDDRDGVEFLLSERGEEEFPGVGLEVHVRPGEMEEWWL